MTTPPSTDQPITATDPRVAQVLALIRAKTGQAPVEPTPLAPSTAQIAPPAPSQPAPRFNELGAPLQPMNELGAALPVPQDAPPAATPQPGPIKSFLQGLVSNLGSSAYQGTQGALQRLGIPTDYEKEQNALKIGLQQQQQNSLEGLRQSQSDLYSGKLDQLQTQLTPTQIPNDPKYGAFAGTTLPQNAATAVMQKMESLASAKDISTGKNTTAQNIASLHYGPDTYADVVVTHHDGNDYLTHKRTGEEQLIGKSNATITGPNNARARAYYNALYGIVPTVDDSGSPTVISRLQALQTGAPNVSFEQAKGVNSDIQGIKLYDQTLSRLSGNIGVLNDTAQRIAIAHTLAEGKDAQPGAVKALITSALQQGALTPQGAQLTADILQARELGGIARKYSGNMNGTEGLMDRIISNQASPINADELNRDLIQNDKRFTAQALGTAAKTLANTSRTPTRGAPATSTSPASTNGHPDFFHPLTK